MFFNQNSDCVLKAKLASAVATTQLEISVTYKDNTEVYHPDAIVATNNTTAVTLLSAPSSGVVNIVDLIKIYNPDTQANTIQFLANDTVIYTYTLGAEQSVIISSECIISSGSANANADLSNLTAAGKEVVSNLPMPSNSYIDLTLGATGSTYTAPANGYVYLCKLATGASQFILLENVNAGGLKSQMNVPNSGCAPSVFIPVKKNDQVGYSYSLGGATEHFRFIYAEGEV